MKRGLKLAGLILVALIGLFALLLAGASALSVSKLNRTYEVTADFALDVPYDPQSIAEGQRLYSILLCAECHGSDLAGTELANDAMFGHIRSPNLTAGAGGIGSLYSDEDIARAVWYGVKANGSPTVVMPAEYSQLQQSDMEMLLAYLRTAPGVDASPAVVRPGLLLRVFHAIDFFPIVPAEVVDLNAPPPRSLDRGDPLALGEYLTINCTGCHGEDLNGGDAPSLAASLGSWTEAEFAQALTAGQRPDGTTLSTEMPWPHFSLLTDAELAAIWTYLQTVAPESAQ